MYHIGDYHAKYSELLLLLNWLSVIRKTDNAAKAPREGLIMQNFACCYFYRRLMSVSLWFVSLRPLSQSCHSIPFFSPLIPIYMHKPIITLIFLPQWCVDITIVEGYWPAAWRIVQRKPNKTCPINSPSLPFTRRRRCLAKVRKTFLQIRLLPFATTTKQHWSC